MEGILLSEQILVSVRVILGGSRVQATIGFSRKIVANSHIRCGIGLDHRFKSLSILTFCDSIMKHWIYSLVLTASTASIILRNINPLCNREIKVQ